MSSVRERLAQVLWLAAAIILSAAGAQPSPTSSCNRKCGEVDIPYPFGILSSDSTDNCSMPGFGLSCNDTGHGVFFPFFEDVQVLNILLQQGQARVRMDMSYSCYNASSRDMDGDDWTLDLRGSPYRFSDTGNKFTVIGCQTLAYIGDEEHNGRFTGGCVAMCRHGNVTTMTNGSCSGIGCCQTAIPKDLRYYEVWFDTNFNTSEIYNVSRCSYAALLEASSFTFSTTYATSPAFDYTYGGQPPLLVDWAIGDQPCKVAQHNPGYACLSSNSECFDSLNGPGYICNCSQGFQGNPYLVDGCKDVDECSMGPEHYPCSVKGTCKNIAGRYECICPRRTKGNAYNGTCERSQAFAHKATIFVGVFACVLLGLIVFMGVEWIKQRDRIQRQDYIRKMNECFQQNGGQLLIDMMRVESCISFKLYHREEIESATNNFDNGAVIGEGGQGTVYLGNNLDPSNNPVAIKRCKGLDESRRLEFGKELLILSRVNHEHIVKLLGCSLQFEAPVLVYEFVPNKTLHYLMHVQDDKLIRTLDIRLKIAIESAEALAYLHSLNHPIFHGDVKSVNILLGQDLSVKVSDFGCSIIRSKEESAQVVKGTMGYLDPEYLLNFELTDKSDVYSFGVVLVELITRRKALSKEKESLVSVFMVAVKNGKLRELVDREIADQDMEVVFQVAELAGQCLAMTGASRPTMNDVAEELKRVVRLVHHGTGQLHVSSPLTIQGWSSSTNTSYDYTGGETTTDYYSHKKNDAMSIEFAR